MVRGKNKIIAFHVRSLTPVLEDPHGPDAEDERREKDKLWDLIRSWIKHDNGDLRKRSNIKLMLGVIACPLAPIPLPSEAPSHQHFILKDSPIETSSASYIIHQYLAATGWSKLRKHAKSMYATGSVRMVHLETEKAAAGSKSGRGGGENGCFVLWKMSPGMWLMELVVAGCKVVAGCNGKVVWRHMPWLGTHAARGPQRPLRRIVQGLCPKITACMFSQAQCLGEKRVGDDDCFVLRVSTDRAAIAERNQGSAEVIRHVLYGYFSQRSGLLVYMEDSHLTRVEAPGSDTVYWETTIGSSIEDYRAVDGVLIAHQGTSVATVFRFGESFSEHRRTRMEERWKIDDAVFDVAGLSVDCFIPPMEILNGRNGSSALQADANE